MGTRLSWLTLWLVLHCERGFRESGFVDDCQGFKRVRASLAAAAAAAPVACSWCGPPCPPFSCSFLDLDETGGRDVFCDDLGGCDSW